MKFLVNTITATSVGKISNMEDLSFNRAFLDKIKEAGILEHAYIKIGGGMIYILNADSLADVRNAFRESKLSIDHEFEIHEIIPTAEQ